MNVPPSDLPRSFTGLKDPAADALLADALPRVAAAVDRLIAAGGAPRRIVCVCLGGGYARGEGGVKDGRLCNDVDFYTVVDEKTSPAEMRDIAAALEQLAAPFTAELGAEVEFGFPKKPSRIRHDRRRVMIQELLRAHVPVWGQDFSTFAPEFPAAALPPGEAARLLMNRGMGLLFAAERIAPDGTVSPADLPFVRRNINKAVLGAGDAALIARGAYDWPITVRRARVGEPAYAAAVAEKFAPGTVAMDDLLGVWRAACDLWRRALEELMRTHGRTLARRSVWEGARWLHRRRTLGPLATFGQDCTVRVLSRIADALAAPRPSASAELRRDWEVFN